MHSFVSLYNFAYVLPVLRYVFLSQNYRCSHSENSAINLYAALWLDKLNKFASTPLGININCLQLMQTFRILHLFITSYIYCERPNTYGHLKFSCILL